MKNPDEAPALPFLPFLIGDAALLGTAWLIAERSAYPFGPAQSVVIASCVAAAGILGAVPFVARYGRRQDAALTERQNQIAALAQTTATSAEQISIATAGLHGIAEQSAKYLKAADQLPHRLQERINEVSAQLNEAAVAENEALQQELNTLRASEAEKLESSADRIHKVVAELSRLEAATQQHLSSIGQKIATLPAAAEQAATEAGNAINKARTAAERSLASREKEVLTRLDERFAAGATEIESRLDLLVGQLEARVLAAVRTLDERLSTLESASLRLASATEANAALVTLAPAPVAPPEPIPPTEIPAPAAPAAVEAEPVATLPLVAEPVSEPAPAPVPVPVPEPEPAPAPAPAPEPVPEPEPIVEVAPTSEPTPAPVIAEAEPLPAPAPAAAPEPEPTPEVAALAPAAIPAPAPAPTPEPEVAVAPSPEPAATPAPAPLPEPTPAPLAAAPEPAPAPKPKAKKPAATRSPDELGLGLVDDPLHRHLGEAMDNPDLFPPDEGSLSSDGFTRLVTTAYIGIGNRLYLRGEGPGLSWEKGVPLQFVSIGKWRWETPDATAPIKAKLYKNDAVECLRTGVFTIQPGHQREITASF